MCQRPTSNGPNERASISPLDKPPFLLLPLLRFLIRLSHSSPISARLSGREKPPGKAGRQADWPWQRRAAGRGGVETDGLQRQRR